MFKQQKYAQPESSHDDKSDHSKDILVPFFSMLKDFFLSLLTDYPVKFPMQIISIFAHTKNCAFHLFQGKGDAGAVNKRRG